MRVFFNGKFSFACTFSLHFILLDLIWKCIEFCFYQELQESFVDTIIGLLICTYITMILRSEAE